MVNEPHDDKYIIQVSENLFNLFYFFEIKYKQPICHKLAQTYNRGYSSTEHLEAVRQLCLINTTNKHQELQKVFNSDLKMSLSKPELACENVILSLKVSRLTFSIQETPYSCYMTIRKRFASHSHHDWTVSAVKCKETLESFENLVKENSSLRASLEEHVLENKSLEK